MCKAIPTVVQKGPAIIKCAFETRRYIDGLLQGNGKSLRPAEHDFLFDACSSVAEVCCDSFVVALFLASEKSGTDHGHCIDDETGLPETELLATVLLSMRPRPRPGLLVRFHRCIMQLVSRFPRPSLRV